MGNPLLVSVDDSTLLFPDAVRKANSFTAQVDRYGAKGDGVTDDLAAIQSAFNAVTAAGGGTVSFRAKTYKISDKVLVTSNTYVDGGGASILMTAGSGYVSFANNSPAGSTGYGNGGRNIHFRDLTFRGDYTGTLSDVGTGWNHVENLTFTNCRFEQGMINGHYIDLGGCRNVRINGCTFLGMNPGAGRSYVEAIQIDVATRQATSNKTEPTDIWDGLPTRDVIVTNSYFGGVTVNGTTYPAPNPIGSHSAALDSDAGYYENISFVNNTVRGTYIPATQAVSGWVHMYGCRGVNVSGNTFIWTGATSSGNPQVVSMITVTQGTPASDVASTSPSTVTFAAARPCRNVTITENRFVGFSAAPTQANTGLIFLDGTLYGTVSNNTFEGSSSSAILANNAQVMIMGNYLTGSSTEPVISVNGCQYTQVRNNVVSAAGGGIGIRNSGGASNQISDNTVGSGATSIVIDGLNNGLVQNNYVINFTSTGISIAPSATTTDVIVSSNRGGTSGSTAVCLLIGSLSTRTRRFGNLWRGPGNVTDSGTGTTTVATDQTT